MHALVMIFILLPVVLIGLLSNYIVAVKECLGSWLYFSLILQCCSSERLCLNVLVTAL